MKNLTISHGTHSGKDLVRDQVLLSTVCIMSYGENHLLQEYFLLTTSSRSFIGYASINSVLSEVRDPIRTIRLAAPLAVFSVAAVYIFINISYFAVVSKRDILESKRIVALVMETSCLVIPLIIYSIVLQSLIFPESIRS